MAVKRLKGHLVDAIADSSCDSADMKSLLIMYYDDVASYMNELTLEELVEIADEMGIEVEKV